MGSELFEYYVNRSKKLDKLEVYLVKLKEHLDLESEGFFVCEDLDKIVAEMIECYLEEDMNGKDDTSDS